MTTWQAFAPSRITRLHKTGAAILTSVLTLVGISTTPTAAAFVDSGAARIDSVTAATVDIAFDDGGREHELTLDTSALHPGDAVSGTLRVYNSGSVDTSLSMATPKLSTDDGDGASLAEHLHLTVEADGAVVTSAPLLSASFDEGAVILPAGGSPTEGARQLTVTVALDAEAPVSVAGKDLGFELLFASSRSTFRVTGTVASAISSVAPVTFPVAMISVGAQHTLVIDGQGGVWAWGHNNRGQLGDGSRLDRFTPVRVAISEKVVAVSAGVDTSIAVTASGRVLTWGNGDVTGGFIGEDQLTPSEVAGPWSRPVAAATGGYFFLIVDEDGALWSWGNNGDGRLGRMGIGSGDISTPGRVTAQSLDTAHVRGIHASRYAAMAFTDDGTVVGWGTRLHSATGRTFAGLPSAPVREVALSYDTWLVLLQDGRVFTSTRDADFEPTSLAGIITISSSVAGTAAEMAFIATDGVDVWAWGSNRNGQLGLGPDTVSVAEPTAVDLSAWGSDSVQSADLGWQHSMIFSADGTFSSVGTGHQGELGSGEVTFRSFFAGSESVKAWPGTVPPPVVRDPLPPVPEVDTDEPVADSGVPGPEGPDADEDPHDSEPGEEGPGAGEEDLEPGEVTHTPDTGDDATRPDDVDDSDALDASLTEALRSLAVLLHDDSDARALLTQMLEATYRGDHLESDAAAQELAHRLDEEGRRLLEPIITALQEPEGADDAGRMLDWLAREESQGATP